MVQRISESLLNIRKMPCKRWKWCSPSDHAHNPDYLPHFNYTCTVYLICNQSKKENTRTASKFWLATHIFYSSKITMYAFTSKLWTSLSHYSSEIFSICLDIITEKLLWIKFEIFREWPLKKKIVKYSFACAVLWGLFCQYLTATALMLRMRITFVDEKSWLRSLTGMFGYRI